MRKFISLLVLVLMLKVAYTPPTMPVTEFPDVDIKKATTGIVISSDSNAGTLMVRRTATYKNNDGKLTTYYILDTIKASSVINSWWVNVEAGD